MTGIAATAVLGVLLVYFISLIVIGVWAAKDSDNVSGYYVAGKKLPSWVIAFSSNATGESAWLLLGLTGMGYLVGIHALWIVLGEVLGVALAWVFVARPFKVYTDRFDSITVPDYLADRFQDSTHTLRVISVLVIFSMTAFYTGAQLIAAGKAFESFFGTSYMAGVVIGGGITFFYTAVGGFKAVAYSDLLQGLIMIGCLVALPVVGIWTAGGFTEMMTTLRAAAPELLHPMGELGFSAAGIVSAVGFVAIGLAFLGSPQLLTRFMSARNTDQITNASVIAVFCIVIFDVGAVLAGMAGRAVFPKLVDPEIIYPVMAMELFPAICTGIFLVVLLAAIMSTVDSLLIMASSALARDVLQKIFKPRWREKTFSRWGKATTVIIGGCGLILALTQERIIFWFVLFAWSGLACAFTPVVLLSLFWKGTTKAGAVAGMLAGFTTTVLWVLVFKSQFYDLYEMVPGFVAGFFFTIVVSLVTLPPEGAAMELEDVHRIVGTAFKPPRPVTPRRGSPIATVREPEGGGA